MQLRYPRYNEPYLRDLDSYQAHKQSITNKCLILDIDRTCLFTSESQPVATSLNIFSDPAIQRLRDRAYNFTIYDAADESGVGIAYTISGTLRPRLLEFLDYAYQYFKIVGICSAGRKRYVDKVVSEMFKDTPRPPDVLFTYEDCTPSYEGIMGKPLSKMINSHPILKKHMSLENTIIVDDYNHSFMENPNNGILIPPYNPSNNVVEILGRDESLDLIRKWLNTPEVRHSTDIRKVPKDNIFSKDTA